MKFDNEIPFTFWNLKVPWLWNHLQWHSDKSLGENSLKWGEQLLWVKGKTTPNHTLRVSLLLFISYIVGCTINSIAEPSFSATLLGLQVQTFEHLTFSRITFNVYLKVINLYITDKYHFKAFSHNNFQGELEGRLKTCPKLKLSWDLPSLRFRWERRHSGIFWWHTLKTHSK